MQENDEIVRHARSLPEQIAGDDEWEQRAGVSSRASASPSASTEQGRHRKGPACRDDENEQKDRGAQELVEDLPVDVDVVPDEVWVQRRDDRGDESGALGDVAAPDQIDEQGRRYGDRDLRRPDNEPVSREWPVQGGQEPAVEGWV